MDYACSLDAANVSIRRLAIKRKTVFNQERAPPCSIVMGIPAQTIVTTSFSPGLAYKYATTSARPPSTAETAGMSID